jgi:hypothetical protein
VDPDCAHCVLSKQKNVKTISGAAESTNLIFQNLKCYPIISGETVPVKNNFTQNIKIK